MDNIAKLCFSVRKALPSEHADPINKRNAHRNISREQEEGIERGVFMHNLDIKYLYHHFMCVAQVQRLNKIVCLLELCQVYIPSRI